MEKLKIGITQGDYNGVGYETILKVLAEPHMAEMCVPIVYGSARIASHYRKLCDLPEVRLTAIESPEEATLGRNYIINVTPETAQVEPGVPTPEAGVEAVRALRAATAHLKEGQLDAIVTCPISKETAQSEDFNFTGHTEFLEQELGGGEALMMLVTDYLRVALVTIHEPISRVAEKITKESVLAHIQALNHALKQDFGITSPRIAVLSLDPHAGDNGVIGTDDQEKVAPAIQEARDAGLLAFGPYPADGFFGSGNFKRFDGILAMYHDQGLAPFKVLAQNMGVNFTAGLNGIRTSPAHGTAFDLAGKGQADEQSLRQAIYTAIDIAHNRKRYHEATANPLPFSKPSQNRGRRDRDRLPNNPQD